MNVLELNIGLGDVVKTKDGKFYEVKKIVDEDQIVLNSESGSYDACLNGGTVEITDVFKKNGTFKFFVYGSLLSGEANERVTEPKSRAKATLVRKGILYSMGYFPALVLEGVPDIFAGSMVSDIAGELLIVDEEDAANMYKLEGYSKNRSECLYDKLTVLVKLESGELDTASVFCMSFDKISRWNDVYPTKLNNWKDRCKWKM